MSRAARPLTTGPATPANLPHQGTAFNLPRFAGRLPACPPAFTERARDSGRTPKLPNGAALPIAKSIAKRVDRHQRSGSLRAGHGPARRAGAISRVAVPPAPSRSENSASRDGLMAKLAVASVRDRRAALWAGALRFASVDPQILGSEEV